MFTTAAEDLFRNLDHEMMECVTEIERWHGKKNVSKRKTLYATLRPKYVEAAKKFRVEMTALYAYTVEHLAAIGKQYRFKASVVYPITDTKIEYERERDSKLSRKAKAIAVADHYGWSSGEESD